MRNKSEQERFWEGGFGAEYTERNAGLAAARAPFFESILAAARPITSVCELGSNRGENLRAIAEGGHDLELTGVEINAQAHEALGRVPKVTAVHSSIQDFDPGRTFDLVFTAGVLIHVDPDALPVVYRKMAELSSAYVLISEYFNPDPVALPYRGHSGKLFKHDFAGEFLDETAGAFDVVDYGFQWKRVEPQWDNTTWFLLRRKG